MTAKKLTIQPNDDFEVNIQFFLNSPVPMARVDENGKWLDINTSFIQMLGYDQREIKKYTLMDISPSQEWEVEEPLFKQLLQGEIPYYKIEKTWRHRNDEQINVRYTIYPCDLSQQQTSFFMIVENITEKKSIQSRLEKTEHNLQEAQKIAHIGSWELNHITSELTWSDEVFSMFGVDKEKFAPSYEAFLEAIHPEDRFMVNDVYQKSLENKKPYSIIHRLLQNGETRYVEEKCRTEFDEQGNPLFSRGAVQDITSRITIDSKLRRFNHLLNRTNEGIFILEAKSGKFIDANDSALKLTKLSKSELLSKHIYEVSDKITSFEEWNNYLPVLIKKEGAPFDDTYQDENGNEVHFEVSVKYLKEESGDILIAVARDVTDRRIIENELIESSRRYSAVLTSTRDGFWLVGNDGRIIQSNIAYSRYSGYSLSELRGKNVQDLEALEDEELVIQRMQELKKEGSTLFESQHIRKDGSLWPVQVSISYSPLGDGQYFAFFRDISERKAKDNELEEYRNNLEKIVKKRTTDLEIQKDTFEKLFNTSPIGEFIIKNGLLIDCNEKALAIFGYHSKEDFLPCSPESLSPQLQPDGKDSKTEALIQFEITQEAGNHTFEWVHLNKNKEEFWCEVTLTPISLPGNEGLFHAGLRDISDEKAKEELHQIIEESKQTKEILLRTLLHDIASPLMVIEYMTNKIEKLHPTKQYQKVERSIASIKEIMESIKKTEALESGKIKLYPSSVNIIDLTEKTIQHIEEVASKKNVKINIVDETQGNKLVLTDPSIFSYQILNNLLTNAIKFSSESSKIDIFVRQQTCFMEITVRDYGVGIPKDLLDKLFHWEAKTSRTGTSGEKGTGFGMPIVKRFIDELGHQIKIESWTESSSDNPQGTAITLLINQCL